MTSLVLFAMVYQKIQDADPLVGALALLGTASVALLGKKFATACFKLFLRPGKKLKKLGSWAVVTGATDGIGKAYAAELAKQGLNLVLLSRTLSKLQAVQAELQEKYNVQVQVIAVDFGQFDAAAQQNVQQVLQKLDIGVLINNVGVSYRYPQFYHELTQPEALQLMELNIISTTLLTRMVLPGMVERQRGAICNLSSGSALCTLPLLAGYAAAKSYVEKFSRALNAEYANISCQCQVPFYVATKLAKMRPSLLVPTPEAYCRRGVRWIGQSDAVASPYWPHALQGWMLGCLPDSVVSNGILRMHMGIRQRGLKKDARLAKDGNKDGNKGNKKE